MTLARSAKFLVDTSSRSHNFSRCVHPVHRRQPWAKYLCVDYSSTWWRRFRRSFEVPDLVTDEHALSIVLASLSPGIGNSGTTVLDPKPAINAIVESALELQMLGNWMTLRCLSRRRSLN